MESEEDRPDPDQVRLVKELHREMADRRIVINSKNRKKKKRRNLTVQVVNHGTSSSGSDSNQNRGVLRRSRSVTRSDTTKSYGRGQNRVAEKFQNQASSDSEISELGDKQQAELFSNKNKVAEARVTTTEGKLQDFNTRLAQRKDKLEELHQKLKQRKERLLEREERLREFEKTVLEKENEIKVKTEELREKDRKLNDQMSKLGIFEALVNTKGNEVANKEKTFGVKLGADNNYQKFPKFPKPILSSVERRNQIKEQSKRISWADSLHDSAISSQSPSSNSSDDDLAVCNLPVSQRLKRFENRQLL